MAELTYLGAFPFCVKKLTDAEADAILGTSPNKTPEYYQYRPEATHPVGVSIETAVRWYWKVRKWQASGTWDDPALNKFDNGLGGEQTVPMVRSGTWEPRGEPLDDPDTAQGNIWVTNAGSNDKKESSLDAWTAVPIGPLSGGNFKETNYLGTWTRDKWLSYGNNPQDLPEHLRHRCIGDVCFGSVLRADFFQYAWGDYYLTATQDPKPDPGDPNYFAPDGYANWGYRAWFLFKMFPITEGEVGELLAEDTRLLYLYNDLLWPRISIESSLDQIDVTIAGAPTFTWLNPNNDGTNGSSGTLNLTESIVWDYKRE